MGNATWIVDPDRISRSSNPMAIVMRSLFLQIDVLVLVACDSGANLRRGLS